MTGVCYAFKERQLGLEDVPCDHKDSAIWWRMLADNAMFALPGGSTRFVDSRLEAAAFAGDCILVEFEGGPPREAPCLTSDHATASAPIAVRRQLCA